MFLEDGWRFLVTVMGVRTDDGLLFFLGFERFEEGCRLRLGWGLGSRDFEF